MGIREQKGEAMPVRSARSRDPEIGAWCIAVRERMDLMKSNSHMKESG